MLNPKATPPSSYFHTFWWYLTLEGEIVAWRETHLSASALARLAILSHGAVASQSEVLVRFPNEETRRLAAGPSSLIAKAVIEEFAPRFLEDAAVVTLSESRKKLVSRDESLLRKIGLQLFPDRLLPDAILYDVSKHLLVFVEVVATDGPIFEGRRQELMQAATNCGFQRDQVSFVTAYRDREDPAYRRTQSKLAWGTFAWFSSEPENIVSLWKPAEGSTKTTRLADLLRKV